MAESESALLQRFIDASDGEAFAEIVRRYAGPVYGTCLRVLADADQAADATQETFFQLVKKAHEVRGSLGGWLHRVAARKAVDLIRADLTRRRREDRYLDRGSGEGRTWSEVSPYVDEALDRLDDSTRELLIHHYLEGRSMTELAEESGVSRPTISRQIDSGLAQLRAHLRRRGVLVAAATLSALLAENTAHSAPAALLQQLSKMALVGAGTAGAVAAPAAAVASGILAAANTKLITAVVAAVVVTAGVVAYRSLPSKPPETSPPTPAMGHEGGSSYGGGPKAKTQEPLSPTTDAETRSRGPDSETAAARSSSARASADSQPEAGSIPDMPETEAGRDNGFHLDLSSPEATVRSFTKAWVCGDPESILACWLPTAGDYEDIRRGVYADPNDPQQQQYSEGRQWFQSLDPDAEMPIISTKETDDGGTVVVWRVTLKKDATMRNQAFRAGRYA